MPRLTEFPAVGSIIRFKGTPFTLNLNGLYRVDSHRNDDHTRAFVTLIGGTRLHQVGNPYVWELAYPHEIIHHAKLPPNWNSDTIQG